MSGMMAYMQAMLKALAQHRLMRRNQIGRGQYKTPVVAPRMGDYTGAQLRDMRARHGVGRPPVPMDQGVPVGTSPEVSREIEAHAEQELSSTMLSSTIGVCQAQVAIWGSQRKAAAALSMNLSTFQRALKKEQA